jgi:hypothetical protein
MTTLARAKLRRYLRRKQNFIRVGTIAGGVPFAIAELWLFGRYGAFGFWLLLVILAFAGAWVCMSVMWLVLKSDLEKFSDLENGG